MVNTLDSDFDEDAAMEALWQSLGRDTAKREQERVLKGYPRNVALEKRGPDIEEMTMRDLQAVPDLRWPGGGKRLHFIAKLLGPPSCRVGLRIALEEF